jgi:two-component system, sensor histidine kinase PdtaS
VRRSGAFGEMAGENATPLALVFTELVTNAVEHGLRATGGTVTITAQRADRSLVATVTDDGCGLPAGFRPGSDGLGTQIVQALVGGELRGTIAWSSPPDGGTRVRVEVTLRNTAREEDTSRQNSSAD